MCLALVFAACEGDADPDLPPVGGMLETHFTLAGTLTLEEVPGDSIADLLNLFETSSGDLLVGDYYLPRVRRYASDGTHLANWGTFGEGPFEFRRIGIWGVVEDAAGRVLVSDRGVPRITVLTRLLEPDTILPVDEIPYGPLFPVEEGFVAAVMGPGPATWTYQAFDGSGHPGWRIPSPTPSIVREEPYWGGVTFAVGTRSADEFYFGTSAVYPLKAYTLQGTPLAEFGTPPPSFVHITSVPPGTFSAGPMVAGVMEWRTSFSQISSIHVIQNRYLVVVHARQLGTPPGMVGQSHEAVDVYEIETRQKLLEDIRLPSDTRVIGGGSALFVLENASGVIPGRTIGRWIVTTSAALE